MNYLVHGGKFPTYTYQIFHGHLNLTKICHICPGVSQYQILRHSTETQKFGRNEQYSTAQLYKLTRNTAIIVTTVPMLLFQYTRLLHWLLIKCFTFGKLAGSFFFRNVAVKPVVRLHWVSISILYRKSMSEYQASHVSWLNYRHRYHYISLSQDHLRIIQYNTIIKTCIMHSGRLFSQYR